MGLGASQGSLEGILGSLQTVVFSEMEKCVTVRESKVVKVVILKPVFQFNFGHNKTD